MRDFLERFAPLRDSGGGGTGGGTGGGAGSGDGGGDGGKGGGDGGGKGGKGAGAGTGAAAAVIAPYHPAGLPDDLKGSDDRGTIDALYNRMNGLRTKIDGLPKVPGKADDYKVTLDDKVSAKLGDLSNDPLMKNIRAFAHEAGLGGDQFDKFMGKTLANMVEIGAFAPQPSDDQVAESLIDPALKGKDRETAIAGARERMTNVRAYVDGLDKKAWSDAERAEMLLMTATPGGIGIVERIMSGNVNNGVGAGGQTGGAGKSAQQIVEARMTDPRNLFGNPKYDPAFAQETERLQRQTFGTA